MKVRFLMVAEIELDDDAENVAVPFVVELAGILLDGYRDYASHSEYADKVTLFRADASQLIQGDVHSVREGWRSLLPREEER